MGIYNFSFALEAREQVWVVQSTNVDLVVKDSAWL